jgi:electron transfer flavoprotein alpha subunit
MHRDIVVLVEHRAGVVTELTLQLLGQARRLANQAGGQAVALLAGHDTGALGEQLGDVAVIGIDDSSLAEFSPSAYQAALAPILRDRAPLLVLTPATAMGMDLASGLAMALDLPVAAFTTGLQIADGVPVVECQPYGGRISATVRFRGGRGICIVTDGAFAEPGGHQPGGPQPGVPRLELVPLAAADARVRFRRHIAPDADDIDITRESVLVSVGRGIGDREYLDEVEQLAQALGGVVSSSRPVVDAGWLPRARQVGRSGQRVRPRLYLALGISGAPEHLEGLLDAELIIAVNSDPNAPIFRVADFGAVADLFDVVPALLHRLG